MGTDFKGVYNLFEKQLQLFMPHQTKVSNDVVAVKDLSSPELDNQLGKKAADKLREDVELIEGVYEPFDKELYREGYLAPVFFGSAINNFGVYLRYMPTSTPITATALPFAGLYRAGSSAMHFIITHGSIKNSALQALSVLWQTKKAL
jgi:peptide chain release factor 3